MKSFEIQCKGVYKYSKCLVSKVIYIPQNVEDKLRWFLSQLENDLEENDYELDDKTYGGFHITLNRYKECSKYEVNNDFSCIMNNIYRYGNVTTNVKIERMCLVFTGAIHSQNVVNSEELYCNDDEIPVVDKMVNHSTCNETRKVYAMTCFK